MLDDNYPCSIVIFTIDEELDLIKQKYITRLHEALYLKNATASLDQLSIQIGSVNHDYFYKIDSDFEFILYDSIDDVTNLCLLESYRGENEFYAFFGSDKLYLGKVFENNLSNMYCFNLINNQIDYLSINNKCLIMSKTERGIKLIYLKEYELEKKEFNKKELIRDLFVKRNGYKVMRIISRKDYLPSDEKLLELLSYSRNFFKENPERSWIEFDIDNSIIRNALHKDGVFFNFGELRKLPRQSA